MNPLTNSLFKREEAHSQFGLNRWLAYFRCGELLFGIGAVCVVHPAAPVFGQHTSSSQQARQHPEANYRPEDKNANASEAQYSKHNDLKVSVHS
jgi:hypothetical protein